MQGRLILYPYKMFGNPEVSKLMWNSPELARTVVAIHFSFKTSWNSISKNPYLVEEAAAGLEDGQVGVVPVGQQVQVVPL